jgi:hypothetical protein
VTIISGDRRIVSPLRIWFFLNLVYRWPNHTYICRFSNSWFDNKIFYRFSHG